MWTLFDLDNAQQTYSQILALTHTLILFTFFLGFNYTFKWVDDHKYGKRNQETGEWNGMMGELLAQVSSIKQHSILREF